MLKERLQRGLLISRPTVYYVVNSSRGRSRALQKGKVQRLTCEEQQPLADRVQKKAGGRAGWKIWRYEQDGACKEATGRCTGRGCHKVSFFLGGSKLQHATSNGAHNSRGRLGWKPRELMDFIKKEKKVRAIRFGSVGRVQLGGYNIDIVM